ncbi:uncharacterized protein PSFLO_07018 [Pseudozyma flocculosa]|uniref:Uncharacterized protein n=1 Tax=Pseudozyma flocculosa TaxID=84751 RepID=A0A5C3FBM3_9BASI|nr:uncharacterized protein PSFLO_07018 [Pseudozyma flocculosa]
MTARPPQRPQTPTSSPTTDVASPPPPPPPQSLPLAQLRGSMNWPVVMLLVYLPMNAIDESVWLAPGTMKVACSCANKTNDDNSIRIDVVRRENATASSRPPTHPALCWPGQVRAEARFGVVALQTFGHTAFAFFSASATEIRLSYCALSDWQWQ